MGNLLFAFSILLFIYPFIDLFFLSKKINELQNLSTLIDSYLKTVNIQEPLSLNKIIKYLFPQNLKNYFSYNADYKIYKHSFYYFMFYFFNGFLGIIFNISIFIISLIYLSNGQLEICLIFSIMNICILWILKLSSIIHCLGFHKIANTLDDIIYSILSPRGKINNFIYNVFIKFILYIIVLFLFTFFCKVYIEKFPIDFLTLFIGLAFFQYILGKLTTLLTSFLFWKKESTRQRFASYYATAAYHYEIYKNTTYLVLLSIYVINKYVQILFQCTSHNLILVEAIGALFLLDTYLDKNKSTDTRYNCTTAMNTLVNLSQEESIMPSNIQTEQNNVKKLSNSPTQASNANSQSQYNVIDIENTAMPEYLEVVKSEYEIERNKKQSFETRSGLLLTLLGAVLVFYFQSVKLSNIIALFSQPLTFIILLKILSGCSIYGLFLFTLISILQTLSAKKHDNFETKGINEQLLSENRKDALARLIFTYRDIISQHRMSNEKRAKWYIASLRSVLLLLLSTIIYISL